MSARLKNGLTVRGDSLYCPLSLSLDTYGNCLNDCIHCYLRRLNHVWGKELKPLDTEALRKQLENGLKNPNPKSPLAWALKQKKTIRFGNKTDPFQSAEKTFGASKEALSILRTLKWSAVIQTKMTSVLLDYLTILEDMKSYIVIQPIISPGLEHDWEFLERKRTTPVEKRLEHLRQFKKLGFQVGVNGEPFIPGYHTEKQFEDTVKLLKANGIRNYNTYNFHFNDFVAKRLHAAGVNILRIWDHNQDKMWKPVLRNLIDICKRHDMILGCPDFVNSGLDFVEQTNTCCGVNVPNPTTFNAMTWKRRIQQGENPFVVFEDSWDGVGDMTEGLKVFHGTAKNMYTLVDAGIHVDGEKTPPKKKGLLF